MPHTQRILYTRGAGVSAVWVCHAQDLARDIKGGVCVCKGVVGEEGRWQRRHNFFFHYETVMRLTLQLQMFEQANQLRAILLPSEKFADRLTDTPPRLLVFSLWPSTHPALELTHGAYFVTPACLYTRTHTSAPSDRNTCGEACVRVVLGGRLSAGMSVSGVKKDKPSPPSWKKMGTSYGSWTTI